MLLYQSTSIAVIFVFIRFQLIQYILLLLRTPVPESRLLPATIQQVADTPQLAILYTAADHQHHRLDILNHK